MKSHASDLLTVAECIYKDATAKCAAVQQWRDLNTLRSRVKHEGLSFLTITLPTLGKDFDKALSLGGIGASHFLSFRKCGRIPAFLQGIFAKVFDKHTGRLLDEPCIASIESIREIAYAFKKLEIACEPSRARQAIYEFLQCELDLGEPLEPANVEHFARVCDVLWSHVLGGAHLCPSLEMIPKHGPGTTEESISGNAKYRHLKWHDRLEGYFPLMSFAFPNENALDSEDFEKVSIVTPDQEQPVRVITVPKTLKSPRIIAIEPVCMQYTQQALARELIRVLESSRFTKGHVNFTCQKVNQELAMKSSADGKFATLDLSSASDRVPYTLAMRMFSSVPDFAGAVDACRSMVARLYEKIDLPLHKFASMGSALCFPVEAMYFYTLCIGSLLRKRNLPVTYQNIYKVSRCVYIYGDDIVIPTDDAAATIDYLQKFYCKVGLSKSYWTGKFRESCGVEAFDGEEVTPTYIKQVPPNSRRDISSLISWVQTSNLFYRKGYWLTSSHLMRRCETILGELPVIGPQAAGLGKVSFQHLVSAERWNKDYHVFEVKTWCAVPVYHCDKLDGYPALMKCLLRLESNSAVPVDEKHLIRSARYGAVALKRRWVRPY
mgnify:FL=1